MRAVPIDAQRVQALLVDELGWTATGVESIGAGVWSQCFAFDHDGQDLVIRIGPHLEDFEKDRFARRFDSVELPIPRVLELGEALDGYYAISTRAWGTPLEQAGADGWARLVPSLVRTMEALRTTDLSAEAGWGGWNGQGRADQPTWHDHLLRIAHDSPDRRIHGWRPKLDHSKIGRETFAWALGLLEELELGAVPRSLVHADLINRNVHVQDDTVTGVFDWGCSIYGDHLYDLAWFQMWSPWHPGVDADALRSELAAAWAVTAYRPSSLEERLLACHLHIGLDHLAYNASIEDDRAITGVAARLRQVVRELSG